MIQRLSATGKASSRTVPVFIAWVTETSKAQMFHMKFSIPLGEGAKIHICDASQVELGSHGSESTSPFLIPKMT